jgi:hypothetical protein
MRIRQGVARSWLLAIGAALAACAVLAVGASTPEHAPSEAAAATKSGKRGLPGFGFTDDALPWTEHVGWARRAGASVGRLPIHHGVVDLQGWSRFDQAYRALQRNGIRPMMVLSGGETHTMGVAKWRTLNRTLARRYPGAALQILNETNHPGFGGQLTPKGYARRLKQAERAIRSVRPKATVIASGAAPRGIYRRPHLQAAHYTRKVFRHIGRKRRIAAAAHIFPSSGTPVREASRALRMVRRAARGRAVWVTETALRASYYDQGARRARPSVRMLRALRRQGARGVSFFRLINDPLRADRDGALDLSGNPTVLYRHLRRAARR